MRSLRTKMVMILVLLILALMAVVGSFLINGVGNYYVDQFHEQMTRVFSQDLIAELQEEAASSNGGPNQLKQLLMAQSDLGIDLSQRNVYILDPSGQVLTYTHTGTVRATAYTHTDAGCDMTTSTGSTVHVGTVAVDPRFIPYGTRMFIVSQDGSYIYGLSQAEDCGGDIIGDRVDLYLPSFEDCMAFGRKNCTVYFLG